MAVQVSDIFKTAMALMDELNANGEAQTSNTAEYERRTPALLNSLLGEYRVYTGDTKDYIQIESLEDIVTGVGAPFCRAALPYGLAALLLTDENPQAASFYQQKYEELLQGYIMRQPSAAEGIIDVYGACSGPYNEFSRW
jgi:hypothetical protein